MKTVEPRPPTGQPTADESVAANLPASAAASGMSSASFASSAVPKAGPRRRSLWRRLAPWSVLLLAAALGTFGILATEDDRPPPTLIPNDLPQNVGFDQNLGAQIPLDVVLRDESGRQVAIGELLDERPVVLALVYYRCPMLCNVTMHALVRGLKELPQNAGRDYTVLTVSFDPQEGPELAAAARKTAVARYGRPGSEDGWRFLTGEADQVARLAESVGFRYAWDENRGQYAHAAGVTVLTSQGVVSRYLFGVEYFPRDLRLALIEASQGTVGSPVDRVLLLCYHYDPVSGKYGLAIMRLLKFSALVTVLSLATAVSAFLIRERRQQRELAEWVRSSDAAAPASMSPDRHSDNKPAETNLPRPPGESAGPPSAGDTPPASP